jgi:hypothetical protein
VSETSQSWLDNEPFCSVIKEQIKSGDTNMGIARLLEDQFDVTISRDSIRRFRKRHGLQIPGADRAYTRVRGDTAEAQTKPHEGPVLDDPDTMLQERGLSPEDWYIDSITVNEWEGPSQEQAKVTYHQAKFTARRKKPIEIIPARPDGWRPVRRTTTSRRRADMGRLIVICGDQQAPFHDPKLHDLFCQWLVAHEPDEGILLGDTVDFPDISRHQLDPENSAVVNECIQSGYDLLRDYVFASQHTEWRKLIGNHDERLRNILLDKPKVQPLYGLKRANTPEQEGEVVFSLRHLLRLDELGIELIDPNGAYELAQVALSDHLACMHGWIVRKGSGDSALATLDHLGYSVIVGHTHRQSIVHQTTHDIDHNTTTLVGVEAGCMCRVEQKPDEDGRVWPNYCVRPDWQQGFVTATVWPDGFFHIDRAIFVNGNLLYRDERYS